MDQLLCASRRCTACHWWSDALGCRLEGMLGEAVGTPEPAWVPPTQSRIPLVLA